MPRENEQTFLPVRPSAVVARSACGPAGLDMERDGGALDDKKAVLSAASGSWNSPDEQLDTE